eukprot:UN06253
MSGCIQSAKYLIDYGTDPQIADTDGYTPLIAAVQFRQLPILEFLIHYSGCVVDCKDKMGRNALHWAAFRNYPICCEWLIHRDISLLDLKDDKGNLPIHYASGVKSASILLEYCSSELLQTVNKDGENCIDISTDNKHFSVSNYTRKAVNKSLTQKLVQRLMFDR